MKIKNNYRYIYYVIFLLLFAIVRYKFACANFNLTDLEFKSIAISSSNLPFGIIKNTAIYDNFLPAYYFLIHFFAKYLTLFKATVSIKILNSLLALLTALFIFKIGRKLLNNWLGLFLAVLITLNHYFLYYSSLIAPYGLNFAIGAILIYFLINYLELPSKRHYKRLSLANCAMILCVEQGIIFVICELIVLYLQTSKKKQPQKLVFRLTNTAFISFLITLPLILTQLIIASNQIIVNTEGIGLNFDSFYLLLNDFVSPYLSFNMPQNQTQTTLGLLYSFFINPKINNINACKILLTLVYGSFIPICTLIFFSLKAYFKNYKNKVIGLISALNLIIILILCSNNHLILSPINAPMVFLSLIILMGYGIFLIKDEIIKIIFVTCLLGITLVKPNVNAYIIGMYQNQSTIAIIDSIIKERQIKKDTILIIPHQGRFAKLYYDKLSIMNFDFEQLKSNSKKEITRNLTSKDTKSINKYNVSKQLRKFLFENTLNRFLVQKLIKELVEQDNNSKEIIILADKSNVKLLSPRAIKKTALEEHYNIKPKKISILHPNLTPNKTKMLYDALKTKTFYNLVNIINSDFHITQIVEYKNVDNDIFKQKSNNYDIFSHLYLNKNSDMVIFVFRKN